MTVEQLKSSNISSIDIENLLFPVMDNPTFKDWVIFALTDQENGRFLRIWSNGRVEQQGFGDFVVHNNFSVWVEQGAHLLKKAVESGGIAVDETPSVLRLP